MRGYVAGSESQFFLMVPPLAVRKVVDVPVDMALRWPVITDLVAAVLKALIILAVLVEGCSGIEDLDDEASAGGCWESR
eukprot:CAMPEP_0113528826 /NCGR_PEP_ID=MMETSP0015_2-20120614/2055_1 /TAXON_ID=2838 /ORGANISM="Odontella" /LENGTH=78 /DNA_ID=CAMNT_0000427391 /DNA_START=361 /DNA_END=593 /DNA_ORIENTATION=+ /assembly_acc=CAM_ASM_000160